MSNYIVVDGELCHYGIKGQKWGVRRYQNKNGSLTAQGKARRKQTSDGDSDARLKSRIKGEDDVDGWRNLHNEIVKKSGDFHSGEGVSSGFKKALKDLDSELKRIDAKYETKSKTKSITKEQKAADKAYDEFVDYEEKLRSTLNKNNKRGLTKEAAAKMMENDPVYKQLEKKWFDAEDKVRASKKSTNESQSKRWEEETRAKNKAHKRLASVVLKDLGYEDTAVGRKLLMDNMLIYVD